MEEDVASNIGDWGGSLATVLVNSAAEHQADVDTATREPVKWRVRQAVLELRSFTAEEICRVTGAKYRSVRTEIQRMLNETPPVLIAEPLHPPQRGNPKRYRLTDNPEVRLQLSRWLETYFPVRDLAEPTGSQAVPARRTARAPESIQYEEARSLLDRLSFRIGQSPKDMARATLEKAASALHYAESDERVFGIDDKGDRVEQTPAAVRAYLSYEYARLGFLRFLLDRQADQGRDARERFIGVWPFLVEQDDQTRSAYACEALIILQAVAMAPREKARWLLQQLRDSVYGSSSLLASQLADLLAYFMAAGERQQIVPVAGERRQVVLVASRHRTAARAPARPFRGGKRPELGYWDDLGLQGLDFQDQSFSSLLAEAEGNLAIQDAANAVLTDPTLLSRFGN